MITIYPISSCHLSDLYSLFSQKYLNAYRISLKEEKFSKKWVKKSPNYKTLVKQHFGRFTYPHLPPRTFLAFLPLSHLQR